MISRRSVTFQKELKNNIKTTLFYENMEFKIQKRENPLMKTYNKQDLDIAKKFTEKLYKEFGNFLKGVIIFGSQARKESKKGSDIDIFVIVDDVQTVLTPDMVETYRIIVSKIIADVSIRIHVTSLRFTTFWEYVRSADPVIVNILRDGIALVDTGFFEPLQLLLKQGRIRPTPEAIWSYFIRAPTTLNNSKWHLLQATLDLYWAVVDSAHAVLMKVGEVPPTPGHIADMLDEKLVKRGLLEKKYADIVRQFYYISKMITRREIKEIKGTEYEHYLKNAEDFVERVKKIIEMKL